MFCKYTQFQQRRRKKTKAGRAIYRSLSLSFFRLPEENAKINK